MSDHPKSSEVLDCRKEGGPGKQSGIVGRLVVVLVGLQQLGLFDLLGATIARSGRTTGNARFVNETDESTSP
jgi:hypothetical protein